MNKVVDFKSKVKAITERASDPMTTNDFFDMFFFSPGLLEPITMGRSGRIHGARTVNNPARTAIPKKSTLIQYY